MNPTLEIIIFMMNNVVYYAENILEWSKNNWNMLINCRLEIECILYVLKF